MNVKLHWAERFINWFPNNSKLYIRGEQGKGWNETQQLYSDLFKALAPFLDKLKAEAYQEGYESAVPATPANRRLRLCYADENWAWFTTCPPGKQWGDDWGDVPFEHNAGTPYEWSPTAGTPEYQIVKVAWSGPFMLPNSEYSNSPFSVKNINAGHIAWLRPNCVDDNIRLIGASVSLESFVSLIKAAGGDVYLKG